VWFIVKVWLTIICHGVLDVTGHVEELIAPGYVNRVQKLGDYGDDVACGVAFEHWDDDQVDVVQDAI
jgi:hypothetical protein